MKILLKDIVSIQTGVFAKPASEGEIVYLQAKHFDENRKIDAILVPDVKADTFNQKHLLKDGDILFSAKGTKNFAACFKGLNLPAVASTSFFVIRFKEDYVNKILPDFLTWYLNNPVSMQTLKAKAIGTSIVSISKVVLEEMEILLPSIKTQKIIIEVSALYLKEKELKQQLEILREKQIQQQINNAINK